MDLYNLVISAKLAKGGGGGGDIDVESLSVTENGVYSAPSGTAYSPVFVSVPQSGITPTGTKNIDANGDYDVSAFASAHVDVPVPSGYIKPSGTKQISSNGSYDVSNFASAAVNISPIIQSLSISENGTYSVPAGVDGYNPITVNVSGGGGGGDHDAEDAIINRMISGAYENSRVTYIGPYAFYSCTSLTTVSFPNVTSIGSSALYSCTSLTTVSFPNVTHVGDNAFSGCANLTTISFPNAKNLNTGAFRSCQALTDADFPNVELVMGGAFSSCYSLSRIILPKVQTITTGAFQKCYHLMEVRLDSVSAVPSCPNPTITFSSTPIGGYSASTGSYGSVYVPASLYNSFLADTNWQIISKRIVSVGV